MKNSDLGERLLYTKRSEATATLTSAVDQDNNAFLSFSAGKAITLLKFWHDQHVTIDHSADNGATWSGGSILTNADINYTSSNVENNYNNYIRGGLYQITGSVATNSPTGQAGSGGILIVFEAQAYVIQFAFNLTTAYYRRYTKSSTSWSAWKTFTSN